VPLNEQVTEMTKRMHQLAAAGDESSEEFKHLQEESARLQTIIVKTNDSVKGLIDDQGLGGLSHSIGEIGSSISHLNFDEALEGAKHFSHQMHSLGTTAKGGLKSLAKTVGTVGKAFLKMGLSLLMNPLFLLVAVVTAIVAGMIMLKDKVAFIGVIFDAIAAPIKAIIQAFKDLLDWIGLTSFAEDEKAEKQQKQARERLNQLKKETDAIRTRNEADKRHTSHVVEGIDLEKRKAKLAGATDKELAKFDKRKLDATVKQLKKDRKAAADVIKKNADKFKNFAKEQLAKAKLEKAGSDEQKKLMSSAEYNYEKHRNQLKIIKQGSALELAEIDDQIAGAEIASQEKIAADAESKADERRSKYKEYAANRLEAARGIQDIELELMAEGLAKELALLNVQFDREIEDTLSNENLKQTEKDKLISLFNEQRKAAEIEARANEEVEQADRDAEAEKNELKKLNERLALDDTLRAARKAQKDLATELEATDEEIELDKLRQSYAAKFEIAEGNFQLQIALKKDLIAAEEKLEAEQADKAKKLKQAEITGNAKLAIGGLQMVAGIAELFADRSEKAARIAFNVQKAAAIAQATMDGYKAVLSTLADTPGGPVIKGIAATITGGMAAVQIANIAKSKFDGGGGGSLAVSAPSGGIGGGGSTGSQASGPSFELFGQSNDLNNVESPESAEQTINVNATVSETEMTETQSNIYNIQQASEL
jgi:hypothetical protein